MFRRTSGGMERRSRRDDLIQMTGLTLSIIRIYKFLYYAAMQQIAVSRPIT